MGKGPIRKWWPFWLAGAFFSFLVPELVAVVRRRGGSLSVWTRSHVPRWGRWVLWPVMVGLAVWLGGHFLNIWW